uniref:Connector enhancer of kinase suppressor of Ras 1 n=1 Tax=Anas platyrhynchos TaxID=8839 RepID=A0A8B9TC57_ANAPL
MEPVGAWGPAQVAAWLRGLDAAVQGYPFEAWGLAGTELLGLSVGGLEALGVRRVGHQELLLDAVEQLRALVSPGTSLRTLTEGLRDLALRTQTLVLEGPPGGGGTHGYLFSTLNDFSASRDIVLLCARLAEVLQADCSAVERTGQILLICQHIVGICESILGCSPPALLDRRAVLERVGLVPPPESWGSPPESPSTPTLPPKPWDEIVQVNEQVVVISRVLWQVGWTRSNLAKKLLEKASGVTLVLKKVPLSPPGSPLSPRQQVSNPSASSAKLGCAGNRADVAADVDSGPDSAPDPGTDEEDERDTRLPGEDLSELPPAPRAGGFPAAHPPPLHADVPPNPAPAGVATRLSRRRVSCRDLGRVDCDGWLLKKKDHVGFMAQKWKRCWFVLKGHTLYWYNHPNDEKAAGLLNLASYNLESTREQKKKYVFQLSHEKYKPFIFAAETLADLNCYSETEAEDPDDEAPRQGCDSVSGRGDPAGFQGCPKLWCPSAHPEPGEEDLESLMQCLKQGGVSLIGRQRFLTQEQCRRSFVRRNKNPHINEKVHAVRALQSTLKAKLAELQALEQLLDDATLTSEKFTRWKEEHQDLYQELGTLQGCSCFFSKDVLPRPHVRNLGPFPGGPRSHRVPVWCLRLGSLL